MKKQWEKALLEYYFNNYNAKWIRVFHKKHPVLATKVIFYTKIKRLVKKQPYCGELTYTNLFNKLKEGDWYNVANLLDEYKEE